MVVSVTRARFRDNSFETQMVQVDVASKVQTVLTSRQARQHQFSPDGRSLAFLSPVEGRTQIFVMPVGGGTERQVSRHSPGVLQFSWRPDGRAISYTALDEPIKRAEGEEHNRSFEATDIGYLQTAPARSVHLWLLPIEGGDGKRLTSGDWSLWGPLRWSPDGKRIAFAYYTAPGNRDGPLAGSRALDVQTGQVASLTGRDRFDAMAGFSPDGEKYAYTWYREGNSASLRELWIAPSGGGPRRNLTRSLDLHVAQSWWSPDSKSVLFIAPQGAQWGLWVQAVDGTARRLELGRILRPYDASVAREGSMALIGAEAGRPFELYLKKSLASVPERLTDFNGYLDALELGKQEPVRWRGPDNSDVDGVLTFPPAYRSGTPYPLVVLIHGGPRASSTLGFEARSQWLAAQGWVVFEPNYRGSNNLGHAFVEALRKEEGVQGAGRDVLSGVDLLIGNGIADPKRVAVSGWSYGGHLTVWLLAQYPDRWRAAVAGAAPVDPIQTYALSTLRSDQAISPFTHQDGLAAVYSKSLTAALSKIKAPTLVLSNTGDGVVPITNSYTLYHALRDNGVQSRLVVYPIPGHGATDPVHQRDVNRRWAEWIKEYMELPK